MTVHAGRMVSAAFLVLAALPIGAQGQSRREAKSTAKAPRALAPQAKLPRGADRQGPAKLESRDFGRLEDVEREAVADKKRDEQIDAAKKIIPKIEDGNPQKADLLFQLSELYWEKSRFLHRREMLKFFAEQKDAEDRRNRGQQSSEPKEEHRESELYRSETMRLYETILREYPAYERKDEVLFNLAYNLYETGKKDGAVKHYEELLRAYPGSKFAADAYVQLGNHYFEVANILEKARFFYEKAFATTNPRVKSYALYKLAWCDFNAGAHELALKKLQDTVVFSENQGKDRSFSDLKNEALQDSIRVYVELNRADEAVDYFRRHAGKKRQVTLITKLAYSMQDAGHHENAIKTFRTLLRDNPVADAAPDYQQAIIKSYEGLRQREQVKAEIKTLAELYRPGGDWWKANSSKKEVLRNGFNVAEEAMRTIVTEYHQEAQKTKQVETYRLARDIYRQYVEAFATNEDDSFVSDQAFNLKFYYAEILWTLEEWETAAAQYDELVAFRIPNRPEAREASNEKYHQQSAYNAILAYEKLVKIERGLLQRTDLKDNSKVDETKRKGSVERQAKIQKRSMKELEEKPLTRSEQLLVAACDRYNGKYPKNADEVDVSYQAAVILYDKNHFVEAARRFGDVINRYPEERRSQEAADLSMSVMEEKEEWLELNKLARLFRANARLAKPGTEFAKRVASIVEGSQYKYVDEIVYRKEKDAKRAAELFVAFVGEFPKSENADRALTYAMLISREATQLERATALGERILREYPLSLFDLKVKYNLAKFYEQVADFERSAAMYEEFVATYDLAAGDQAIGHANVRELRAKQREQADKEAKATKGKAASSTLATVDLKKLDDARKRERASLIAECTDQKDNWVQNAVYNAGFWFEGVGKLDRANAAYQHYILRFKDAKDAPDIAYNMGLVLEKADRSDDAIRYYDGYLASYAKDTRVTDGRRLEVRYRQLQLHGRLRNAVEQERLAREIAVAFSKLKEDEARSDRAKLAAAHARFLLLEPQYRAYEELRFRKLSTFKRDREAKQKRLEELEKAYTEVLAVKNPDYGIAALTRIGLIYSSFAAEIAELPDPQGFDEDQVAMFRSELESRYVFPVEEKAVEAYEKAIAKSVELTSYSEWVLLAQEKVNKYRPGFYSKPRALAAQGSELFVRHGAVREGDLSASPRVGGKAAADGVSRMHEVPVADSARGLP